MYAVEFVATNDPTPDDINYMRRLGRLCGVRWALRTTDHPARARIADAWQAQYADCDVPPASAGLSALLFAGVGRDCSLGESLRELGMRPSIDFRLAEAFAYGLGEAVDAVEHGPRAVARRRSLSKMTHAQGE